MRLPRKLESNVQQEPPLLGPRSKNRSLYLSKSKLKARGWTEGLITQFLPTHDATFRNLHRLGGPLVKLYLISRVETVEASDEFLAVKAVATSRQTAARRAVETKTAQLLDEIDRLTISVRELTPEELVRRACDSYNSRPNRDFWARPDSDPDFISRITVNFLRHEMTCYHEQLQELFGKVGKSEAYSALKTKILDAIEEAYPWLSAECTRQRSGII